jgi:hypothetical protein
MRFMMWVGSIGGICRPDTAIPLKLFYHVPGFNVFTDSGKASGIVHLGAKPQCLSLFHSGKYQSLA